MSLKKQAIKGIKWTAVAAFIAAASQILQVAVLARFLDKKAFGLMAIAISIISITQIFMDMGISNSIIQKQQVNRYQLNSLYWLNIVIGLFLFSVLFFGAPLLSNLYTSPELTNIVRTIAVVFLIMPWGQQFESLLLKELNFKAIALRDIFGRLVGLILAVVLAILNFGVYALVYASIANVFVSTALLILFGLKKYKPKFVFTFRSLKGKGFFSFGLYQMGEKLLNYFVREMDTLLIGYFLGMNMLGVYTIAKNLTMKPYQLINPVVTKIAFPVLSKIQNEISRFKSIFLKIVRMLATLNAFVYGLIILLAKPLVLLLFGKAWLVAVPIVQILSLSGFLSGIGNPVASLVLAKGHADWGFFWTLVKFFIVPVSIYFGVKYGLAGASWALFLTKLIAIIPTWYFLIRLVSKASLSEYLSVFSGVVLIALIAGSICYFAISTENIYWRAGLTFGLFFIIFTTLILLFQKSVLTDLKDFKIIKS